MKNLYSLLISFLMLAVISGYAQSTRFAKQHLQNQNLSKPCETHAPGFDFAYQPSAVFKSKAGIADNYGELPEVDWLDKFGGSGNDVIRKTVADDAGNVYLIGDFSGTIQLASSTLTSVGTRDVFVAKMDASSNLLWIHQGSSGEYSSCILYDLSLTDEHLLLAGYFDGSTFSMDESSVNLAGLSDALLIKITPDGQIAVLRNIAVLGTQCRALAIACDGEQNIYLTGTTDGSTSYRHPSFLTKVDADGNTIWWQQHEAAFNDLAVSGTQLFVAGSAYQDIWLGDVFIDPLTYSDAFVVKASLNGVYEWGVYGEHNQGSWGDSYMPQIEVGGSGNVFMAGYFRNNVEFGGVVLTGYEAFIVKITPDGEVVWATATENTYGSLNAFALLENEQPCISGRMDALAMFGNIELVNPTGQTGNYLAIYNSSGTATSAFLAGNASMGLAPIGENRLMQVGSTGLDAFVMEYDHTGMLHNEIKSTGNSGTSKLTGLEIDSTGRMFSLSNSLGYDNFFGNNITTPKQSLILAGHAPNGNLLWTAIVEGGVLRANYIETELKLDVAHNKLFLHGTFNDTLKIGDQQFTQTYGGAFLASYSINGEFGWAQELPPVLEIHSVDTDAEGHVYYSCVLKDTLQINGESFIPRNNGDGLVLKYDMNGNYLWGSQTQTDAFLYSLGIATIPTGGYYLTMELAGDTVFFNDGNITMFLSPNDGGSVVARYDADGNYIWAKAYGNSSLPYGRYYCWPTASVSDPQGNLYLTGSHGDSAMFDNILLRSPYYSYSNYAAKIDGEGNVLWANSIQSHRYGSNYCEAEIDNEGNFYCMGRISDTVHFGDWQYVPANLSDMYVVRYDNTGDLNWVQTIESTTSGNHLYGLAVFETDNLYVGGYFQDRILVNGHELYTPSSQSGMIIHLGDTISYASIGDDPGSRINAKVYPNPASDFVYLNFQEFYSRVNISFTDLSGHNIQTTTLRNVSGTQKLGLDGMPKGTYLLTISADGKTVSKKIMIHPY